MKTFLEDLPYYILTAIIILFFLATLAITGKGDYEQALLEESSYDVETFQQKLKENK